MFCSHCGTQNPDEGRFCTKCGSALQAGIAPTAPHHPPAPLGPAETSGKAIGSLICGLLSFIFPAAIAAIVLGHLSLSEIRKSAGRIKGHGLAVAGLVLGYMGVAVIPIVLIIAAIAIPNLLRARQAANEASAIGTLRSINEAAITYATTYSNGYPATLEILAGSESAGANCNNAGLLNESVAAGQVHGYLFSYALEDEVGVKRVLTPEASKNGCTEPGGTAYELTADPVTRGTTGQRGFYTDQTGVIRSDKEGSASVGSEPLN